MNKPPRAAKQFHSIPQSGLELNWSCAAFLFVCAVIACGRPFRSISSILHWRRWAAVIQFSFFFSIEWLKLFALSLRSMKKREEGMKVNQWSCILINECWSFIWLISFIPRGGNLSFNWKCFIEWKKKQGKGKPTHKQFHNQPPLNGWLMELFGVLAALRSSLVRHSANQLNSTPLKFN